MTWYVRIRMMQIPSDMGTDRSSGRQLYGFNILADKENSVTFEEEIVKVLLDASVGVSGVSIFYSSSAHIPDLTSNGGAVLVVTATGGSGPMGVHNQDIPKYPMSTAQVMARAGSLEAARAMAYSAYDALAVVKNQAITA